MTAVATRQPHARRREEDCAESPAPRLFEPSDGPTLEDAILETWDALARADRTTCLVCGGEMSLAGCKSCGSELG